MIRKSGDKTKKCTKRNKKENAGCYMERWEASNIDKGTNKGWRNRLGQAILLVYAELKIDRQKG